MVVLGAQCYYGKGIQSKVIKVNKCTGRSLGETRQKLPRVQGITQYVLHSLAVSYDNTCGMLSIRKTCFSLGVQGFYWDWSGRQSLPSVYPIPDSWKESDVLSFIESFIPVKGTIYWSSSQPTAKGQSCKQAFLRIVILDLQC